jgi:hypothetical protein
MNNDNSNLLEGTLINKYKHIQKPENVQDACYAHVLNV